MTDKDKELKGLVEKVGEIEKLVGSLDASNSANNREKLTEGTSLDTSFSLC